MLRRMLASLLAASIAFAPIVPALASQNTLQMPTTGTVSGLQFSNKVTDALDSLVTCNSGSSAPTNPAGAAPKLGQCWLDTTSATLVKKYRYSGAGWLLEGVLDVSNGIWTPPIGGGSSSISSATTTSVCGATVPHGYLTINGTTTITSFGTGCPAGQVKAVTFADALTLTHDGTALILPGAASITTAAGDVALLFSEGSGNWRVAYFPATGNAVTNPAVPLGTYLMSQAVAAPSKYVFGYGQALTRASYPDFVTATTIAQSGTRTSSSRVITGLSDTSQLGANMPVEGSGIPAGATISSVDSVSQITLDVSHAATTSGTSTVTVFPNGYGSAGSSSTIGVADCQGVALVGRSNMSGTNNGNYTTSFAGVNGQALGSTFGSEKHTLITAEIPAHSHGVTDPGHTHTVPIARNIAAVQSAAATDGANNSNTTSASSTTGITIQNAGGGTAHAIMNPSRIANCFVRVLP